MGLLKGSGDLVSQIVSKGIIRITILRVIISPNMTLLLSLLS